MRSRLLPASLLVVAAAAVLPAPAVAGEVVAAGSLRAEIEADPWSLRFVDASGREVLRQAGASPVSGPLGFRAAGVWRHATRVVDGGVRDGRFVATLATTDPLRRLAVEIAPDGEGVVSVSARVLGADAASRTPAGTHAQKPSGPPRAATAATPDATPAARRTSLGDMAGVSPGDRMERRRQISRDPSSRSFQRGLCATSHGCPAGSTKTPE